MSIHDLFFFSFLFLFVSCFVDRIFRFRNDTWYPCFPHMILKIGEYSWLSFPVHLSLKIAWKNALFKHKKSTWYCTFYLKCNNILLWVIVQLFFISYKTHKKKLEKTDLSNSFSVTHNNHLAIYFQLEINLLFQKYYFLQSFEKLVLKN